jgi:FkbM family methyltransferase
MMRSKDFHEMYDHHTYHIMRMILSDSSNCIDVGAHVGSILNEIIKLAPHGSHYAFEPIPSLHQALREDARYSSVTLYDYALSDQKGEHSFFLVKNDMAYSGLKQRRYDRDDPQVEEIRVKTACLDDLVSADQTIKFIKIDVEGGELPVMRGAERLIRQHQPYIIFESGLGASDRYGTDGLRLYEFLVEKCEMEINTLDGFLLGRPGLLEHELVRLFETTERYYFIANRCLEDHERQENFRNYVMEVDFQLYNSRSLMERLERLETQQLRVMEAALPPIQVDSWGPKETCKGVGFNVQPNGNSAMWLRAKGVSLLDQVVVWFGPNRSETAAFIDGDLITTAVPQSVIDNVGTYEIVIAEEFGRRTSVGTFLVNS